VVFVHVGQRQTDHVGRPVTLGGRPEPGDPGQPLLVQPFQLAVAAELVLGQTDVAQTVEIGEQSRRQRGQVVVVQSAAKNTNINDGAIRRCTRMYEERDFQNRDKLDETQIKTKKQ